MPPSADPSAAGGLARPARRGRRLALLIGASIYDDPDLSQLRAPGCDTQELTRVLHDPRIGGYEVEVELNAPFPRLQEKIVDVSADLHPDDQLLLYLSCHGVLDGSGRLYYATSDTKRSKLAATAIAAVWLNERLDDCRAGCQVLVLDCCHSGAFARGARGGTELALGQRFEPQGRGRVVLTASRGTEYSFEGDQITGEGLPSVFTRAVVDGLSSGDADRDQDGRITVTDLYGYVYDSVRAAEPRQTPGLWTYRSEGDIVIARSVRGPLIKPAQLPADLRITLESPRPRVRASAVAELADLLDTGEPGLVLAARQALAKIADADVPEAAEPAQAALAASAGTAADRVQRLFAERARTANMVGQTDREQAEGLGRSTEHEDSGQPAKRRRGKLLVLAGVLVAALAVSLVLVVMPGTGRTNKPPITPPAGPPPIAILPGRVKSVAFSHDGAVVAAGTSGGLVREWDAGTHTLVDAMADPDSNGVNDVAFSFDNTVLATADANGKVYLWAGSRLAQILPDPSGSSILSVAFSPDKGYLAIGDADGNVWVCAITEDRCGQFDLRGDPETDPYSGGVTSLAFNPQNNALAAGDANGKIFMWIHTLGNTIADPSGSAIRSVTFTPDNKFVVAGDAAGRVYEWGYTSTGKVVTVGKHPVVPLTDPDSMGVESVSVSSDGQFVAAADVNHHVYVWHGGTLVRSDFTDPSGSSVLSVAFDDLSSVESGHVSELLAIGDASGRVYLWPVASDLVGA
jgi:hypothetical protein